MIRSVGDAVEVRCLPVPARGIDVLPERRVAQHEQRDHRRHDEEERRDGDVLDEEEIDATLTPVVVVRREPGDGPAFGEHQGHASEDGQPSERDHEGRDLELGDGETLRGTTGDADGQGGKEG